MTTITWLDLRELAVKHPVLVTEPVPFT